MTIQGYIREKTAISLRQSFIDEQQAALVYGIDFHGLPLHEKARAIYAVFLTKPLDQAVDPPQELGYLIFAQRQAHVWDAENGLADYEVNGCEPKQSRSSSSAVRLLKSIFRQQTAKERDSDAQSGHTALPPFVCEVLRHSYRDILLDRDYECCCPTVRIGGAVYFKLLLGCFRQQSGRQLVVLGGKSGIAGPEASKINSKFLLPGAKIFVASARFRGAFVQAAQFRLLGGYSVPLISQCLRTFNEQLKALHIAQINRRVQDMLEHGAGFEDIRYTWTDKRLALCFAGSDLER